MYMIYTERILGTGSTFRDSFKCKGYSIYDSYIEFWNPELTKHYFISIHKMDHIMIETIDNKENKDGEIKCTT
jgi:hypothetical protein